MIRYSKDGGGGAAEAITVLIVETFRLNGRLLDAGNELVAELGLTSARWQVLGAIAASPVAQPIAHIARDMGLSRQAVRRLVSEMERDGLVRLAANPHHARARLVVMSVRGETAFRAAMSRQAPWAARLGRGLTADEIAVASKVLAALRANLDKQGELP